MIIWLSTLSKMSFKEGAVKYFSRTSRSAGQSRSICFPVNTASHFVHVGWSSLNFVKIAADSLSGCQVFLSQMKIWFILFDNNNYRNNTVNSTKRWHSVCNAVECRKFYLKWLFFVQYFASVFVNVWQGHFIYNFICLCCIRQLLSNGSLYVESRLVEEGMYQCQASVRNVGVLLSRMAHVKIACKFNLCMNLWENL